MRQARLAEEQERYPEAIKLFEEYLNANPQPIDSTLSKHLADLKRFNGHMQMAKFSMDKSDFDDAREDYSNALKLRPNSKAAQAGLAEANARLGQAQ